MRLCQTVFLVTASLSVSALPVAAGNNSGAAFSLWPDTGQTSCYDAAGNILDPCPSAGEPLFGQDAQYAGLARSYTKLDDSGNDLPDLSPTWAMVRDNVTGLIWEVKQAQDGVQDYANPHDANNTYTWCDTDPNTNGGSEGTCGTNDTMDFLAALNTAPGYGGYTDWRIPTVKELKSIVDRGRHTPPIDLTYFPETVSYYYWTASTHATLGYAFIEDFISNYSLGFKSDSYYVRAVRGGNALAENRFVDNLDGTVTDTSTCLQWQQASADINSDTTPDAMTWQDALTYAEDLSLGGKDDWRLPDINELGTLLDHSRTAPAIDITAFPDTLSQYYWSSSTMVNYPNLRWVIQFDAGHYTGFGGADANYVRAVRGTLGDTDCISGNSSSGSFPWTMFLPVITRADKQ